MERVRALMLSDEALIDLYHRADPSAVERAARAILNVAPDRTVALRILGVVLFQQRRFEDALPIQTKLLSDRSEPLDIINIAATLRGLGRDDQAIALLRRVLDVNPGNSHAASNLGALLLSRGRAAEAEEVLTEALAQNPEDPDLLTNRGAARLALSDFEGGRQDHCDAYDQGGRNPALLNSIGCMLLDAGRLSEAQALFSSVLATDPNHVDTLINLAICRANLGHAVEAEPLLKRAADLSPDLPRVHGAMMMLSNYLPDWSAADSLACGARFEAALRRKLGAGTKLAKRPPRARLRVGLVSGDLRRHPVGYFLAGVLGQACGEIDFFAYPTVAAADDVSERLRTACIAWKPINALTDHEAARMIQADSIDILIDLAGHTEHNRLGLFVLRAAPVQISWLGYSATTGLSDIDYFVGDEIVAPPEMQGWFTERLIRLPTSYLCYTPPEFAPPVAPPPAMSSGTVTFGCYNKLSKLNRSVVACWSAILNELPGARLILQNSPLADANVAADIRKRFAEYGVHEQLVLRPGTDHATYLASFADIDIALDPFPFPGGTTTYDALWMGVPTVTLLGDRFLARAGASFAHSSGLRDWVASDIEGYKTIAVDKARDLEALAALRRSLRVRVASTALFDAKRFAPGFVAMLRSL